MKTILVVMILIWSVVFTGCPVKSVNKARQQSRVVATYTNAAVSLTRTLYETHVITIDQKDVIADKFIILAKAGIAFDILAKNINDTYGLNVPKSEIQKLFQVFDAQIVAAFISVLSALKIISIQSKYIAILDSIRTAVLIIAGVFNQRAMISQRIV